MPFARFQDYSALACLSPIAYQLAELLANWGIFGCIGCSKFMTWYGNGTVSH